MYRKRQFTIIPAKSAYTAAKKTAFSVNDNPAPASPQQPQQTELHGDALLAEIERLEISLGLRKPADPVGEKMTKDAQMLEALRAVTGIAPVTASAADRLSPEERAEIAAKMAQPSYQVRETIPAEAARKASTYAAELGAKPAKLVTDLLDIQQDKRYSAEHKAELAKPILDKLHSEADLVEIDAMIDALDTHIADCELASGGLLPVLPADAAAQVAVLTPTYQARWQAISDQQKIYQDWRGAIKRGDTAVIWTYMSAFVPYVQKLNNGGTPNPVRELIDASNAALMTPAQRNAQKQITELEAAKTKLRGAAASIRTASETRIGKDGAIYRRTPPPMGGY